MELPKNERRKIQEVGKINMLIYGVPFSGKTRFADTTPNPLMLNSDGNIKFVTAPYLRIKDERTERNGRMLTDFGWDKFSEVIDELSKKNNTYETIILDLTEHYYEMCRAKILYDEEASHESDNSFKLYTLIRDKFYEKLKLFYALDYNCIAICHENKSQDITRRTGDKVTRISPDLDEKTCNRLAGLVDIIGRMEPFDNKISFIKSEIIFGGGRMKLIRRECNPTWEDLMKLIKDSSIDKNE